MRESAESRSAAVRAVLLRFYPHQYAWGKSCALTVSLLLRFTEAAHDSQVRNPCAASVNLSSKLTVSAHDSPQAYWCG